jgi:hypothetical protein
MSQISNQILLRLGRTASDAHAGQKIGKRKAVLGQDRLAARVNSQIPRRRRDIRLGGCERSVRRERESVCVCVCVRVCVHALRDGNRDALFGIQTRGATQRNATQTLKLTRLSGGIKAVWYNGVVAEALRRCRAQ